MACAQMHNNTHTHAETCRDTHNQTGVTELNSCAATADEAFSALGRLSVCVSTEHRAPQRLIIQHTAAVSDNISPRFAFILSLCLFLSRYSVSLISLSSSSSLSHSGASRLVKQWKHSRIKEVVTARLSVMIFNLTGRLGSSAPGKNTAAVTCEWIQSFTKNQPERAQVLIKQSSAKYNSVSPFTSVWTGKCAVSCKWKKYTGRGV